MENEKKDVSEKPKTSGNGRGFAIASIIISAFVIVINYFVAKWIGEASNEYSYVARILVGLFPWAGEAMASIVAIAFAIVGHIRMKNYFKENGIKKDENRSASDIASIVLAFHPILNVFIFFFLLD